MLSRMVSALRPLLATVLCAGLGLAVAPSDAPTIGHATLTCPHHGCEAVAVRWTIDTPDFVAPAAIAAPARPRVVAAATSWSAAPEATLHTCVLDVAPKTSPPA